MPHDLPEDLADAVRRAYVAPVDDATAERHVAAIAAAAREADTPSSVHAPAGRGRRRRRALRPALAAGFAVLVLPAGLAVAGVDLPDAVEKPYEVVGVELPNQSSEQAEERTKDVRTAPPAERPVEELPTPAPVVPDGGVREGHGADDAAREREAERRSEERNKSRRGDERRRENRPKTVPQTPARPKATPPKVKPRVERAAPRSAGKPQKTTPVRPSTQARPKTTPVKPTRRVDPVTPNKPAKPEKLPKGDTPTP